MSSGLRASVFRSRRGPRRTRVPVPSVGPSCVLLWRGGPRGDCYVFVEVTDPTPAQNTLKDSDIWQNDGLELFTGFDELDKNGSLRFCDRQVLIRGAKSDATHAPMFFNNSTEKNPKGRTVVVPGPDGKSYTIEAAIPFSALGFTPKAGQEILFDLVVDDGGNGRRMLAWNGTARDSRDRGSWGRATFGN